MTNDRDIQVGLFIVVLAVIVSLLLGIVFLARMVPWWWVIERF